MSNGEKPRTFMGHEVEPAEPDPGPGWLRAKASQRVGAASALFVVRQIGSLKNPSAPRSNRSGPSAVNRRPQSKRTRR